MLRVVVTRIAKSRLQGNRSGLRKSRYRVLALGSWFTRRGRTSSSATSIGTEENSLGVPKASGRALIYMKAQTTQPKSWNTSTKSIRHG